MKRLLLVFGLLGAGIVSPAAEARECFATPAALYAAHPNAAHASYTHLNRAQRCWYADGVTAHARTPARRHLAAAAPAASRAAAAPAHEAVATVTQAWHRPAPPAPPSSWRGDATMSATMLVPFPSGLPPSPQLAVDAPPLNRLLSSGDAPADFESRFSASGYRVHK